MADRRAVPQLTAEDWRLVEREYCQRRLVNFVRQAWPVVERESASFIEGWAVGAICDHLQAVTNGEIKRLLINVPPGMSKSVTTCVYWPAWEWGPRQRPGLSYLTTSYSQTYATRDARRMRDLVTSDWYAGLWGSSTRLKREAEMSFENVSGGWRDAKPFSSLTGGRADRVVLDDPHSMDQAESQAERERAVRRFTEVVPSRVADPRESAIVVIMQRLNANDVSGVILERELGYEHLCLPMEYEPQNQCVTSIGFQDPRTEEGELLFPERFPETWVKGIRNQMGEVPYAGQFQQRPMPRGGGMFPVDRFQITPHRPEPRQIKRSVRFWDKAGTHGGGAYTAGVLIHLMHDGSYVVSDVVRGQWSAGERERRIQQTAQADGKGVTVWVEQEPGSGGKESAQSTIRNLSGFRVHADRVTGDKESRAEPYAAQVEGGNVWLVQGEWNRAFLQEHETFPAGQYKDQVDAAAGAFAKLQSQGEAPRLGAPVQVTA